MKALTLILAMLATPTMAQENCAPYNQAVENLASEYGEYVQSMGYTSDGLVMEIYANTATGSWAIVITGPDGMSCMVDYGSAYRMTGEDA